MKPIREYELTAGAKVEGSGISIPAGARMVITAASYKALSDDTYELRKVAITYTDNTYTKRVKVEGLEGVLVDNLGGTNPTSAPKTQVKTDMNARLDAASITYTEDPS